MQTVPRVDDGEEFVRRREPVIVRGQASRAGWPQPSAWSAEEVLRKYGDGLSLRVSLGTGFPLLGGGHQIQPVKSLREVLETCLRDERVFVFDSDPERTRVLEESLPTPSWLAARDADSSAIVSLGGLNSGLAWHTHGETWLVALAGRKRWFVYPPGSASSSVRGHPFYGAAAWATHVLPHLPPEQRPLTFLQEPGDLFYLPAGWAHATVNLDDVLGFGRQRPLSEAEGDHLSLARGVASGAAAQEVDPEACTVLATAAAESPELLSALQSAGDGVGAEGWTPARLLHRATEASPLHLPSVVAFARDADALAPGESLGAAVLRRAAQALSDSEPGLLADPACDNVTLALAWSTLARNMAAAARTEDDMEVAQDLLARVPRLVQDDALGLELLGLRIEREG